MPCYGQLKQFWSQFFKFLRGLKCQLNWCRRAGGAAAAALRLERGRGGRGLHQAQERLQAAHRGRLGIPLPGKHFQR